MWPPRFAVSFDQLAALLALNLFVWAALDALHADRDADLALDGLFGWTCYLLLALLAAGFIARAYSRAADTRALLVPALAAAPYVLVIFWLAADLRTAARHPLAATVLTVVYLCALSVRVLGAAFGRLRTPAVALALALIITTPWTLELLNLDTRLWISADASTQEADDPGVAEELLYDQPARIAAAVESLQPAPAEAPQVYFVGFAGDGDQAVFRREALYAAQAFGARFHSTPRSVLLINDVEDRDSYPLASVSGLAQTLKLLTSRMNPEEDVLVLFLTSHGSEEGLEVQNGSLPLAQLTPADLQQALDASGIRWRIVVVSACYAGVFLDELKTDSTAVVTASDSGHSSFGCDADRDLTWFGEAFLKDALPGSDSLEDAFHKAAALIARREDAEHQIHSNPLLYIGPLMRAKLEELQPVKPGRTRPSYTVRR
ncbi:MAG TPA: C13 family peptidase [Steroidobacteraceae bacterium]|nr:C13 family peptidase [Steroidobacteraceae bacterium]